MLAQAKVGAQRIAMRYLWFFVCFAGALLYAALVPAFAFGLLSGTLRLVPFAFRVAMEHALVLGLPLVGLLWWKRWVNAWTAVLGGLVVGALGIGVFLWPLRFWEPGQDASIGSGSARLQAIIDGVPTLAGWLQYATVVVPFAIFGALGGLAFWATLRITGLVPLGRARVDVPAPARRLTALLPAAAFVLALAVLALPRMKDWSLGSSSQSTASCHNKLFGHTEAGIDLAIAVDEWDALTTIYQDLAAELKLSLLDQSEVRPEVVRTLYLSICNDDLVIKTGEQRWAPDYQPSIAGRGVGIHVYSDASPAAQSATRRLIQRLHERWPDEVRFVDRTYNFIPTPANLEPEPQ
jgi:hypothetical protein